MANSSDWINALLERPEEEVSETAPLSWLPDFSKRDVGFVKSLPFERLAPESTPEPTPEYVPLQDAQTGDALEDVLRRALADREAEEVPEPSFVKSTGPQSELTQEPLPQSEAAIDTVLKPTPDIEPDPIAEAFARGEAEGRQAAIAEGQALEDRKLKLRHSLRAFDQAGMDALASDLAETVIALCSQTLADFIPAPDALKARCRQAAERLGAGAGEVTLYLHPDDLVLIDQDELTDWRIVGDPAAERGGLRLETADGTVSDRPSDWRRAIATAIKG